MPYKSACIALAALLLCGCATSALNLAPSRPDRPWTPVTGKDGEIVAGAASVESASATQDGYVLPANHKLAQVPGLVVTARTKPYSLAALIDLAESNNPSTRVAWNDARRAALTAGIAESAWLPQVTATVLGGYTSSANQTPGLVGNAHADTSGRSTVALASLQWLLFDFGQRSALIDAAQQVVVASDIGFTAAHQKVIHDVSVAFYAYAAARAHARTAAASLANAHEIQAAAEQRHHQGVGTVIEVSQARLATAQAKLAAVQSRGSARNSYLDLLGAVGVSPLSRIPIASLAGRKLPAPGNADLNQIVMQALARRPDVLAAYANEEAQRARVRAAKAAFWPKLFLSATGAHYSNNAGVTATPSFGQSLPTVNLRGSGSSGAILLGITMPLYDGGILDAHLDQARVDAQNAALKLDQTRKAAVRQIVRAESNLRSSLQSNIAAAQLQDASQVTFDAALEAYRNGVGTITAVTTAQTQLLNANNAATDAHSAALSSAATLALATGTLGRAP